jgi:succinyl-diaminopimelate desuccinylase
MTLDIFHYDGKTLKGQFDSRIPVCGTNENVCRVIETRLEAVGFTCTKENMSPVHYVPVESQLVQSLMKSYERYTGIKGEPVAIGGGTYVHSLKRGVAFGCEIEGVDNHMHGDDEFMEVDVLVMSAKIFADAIVQLCC